ncbi:MAG TPA: Na/Pi cotransporter family protein, partial [Firmicutes bacterium]|nr:Na/Pi cotransporter family protein [Bacillota bacterium]
LAFIANAFPTVDRQAANANIIFNVVNALLMLPFISLLERLVERLLPGIDPTEQAGALYLDSNLLNTPSVALGQAARELVRMGNLATEMLDKSLAAFSTSDRSYLTGVEQMEETIDQLERDIVDYLVRLSQNSLSNEQSARLNALLHVSSDLERIGDHAQNIADLADYRIEHRLPLSEEAEAELQDMSSQVRNLVAAAVSLLTSNNTVRAKQIMADEGSIDLLEKSLRRQHIKRLNSGICFPASGILYLDLISNLERVADHANNIAEALADMSADKIGSTSKVSYSASN